MSAVGLPPAGRRPSARAVALSLALAVALASYAVAPPRTPDLAAQLTRAAVASRLGPALWWPGWFAGLELPTYSVLVPPLAAALGVGLLGALSVAGAIAAVGALLRGHRRRFAVTVGFAVTDVADLLVGRVTFSVGVTLAVLCLLAIRRARRGRTALAAISALLTTLASPLAGLFLGLVALAVLATRRPAPGSRRPAAAVCAVLLLAAGSLAVAFPASGRMPYDLADLLPPLGCTLAVAVLTRVPVVRTAALLYVAALLGFLAVPGAVGVNITRLAWFAAVPAVLAGCRGGRVVAVLAAVVLASYPASDLSSQLRDASDASAGAAYYRPLAAELARLRPGAPRGARLEVVDPRTHYASEAFGPDVSLARGWDRQADDADYPLFYGRAPLTPATYRAFLDQLAVAWVAVPDAPLDYAARGEAALVDSAPAYLRPIWSDRHWRLYAVSAPRPLAEGASVVTSDAGGLQLLASATQVPVALRWSPWLAVTPAGCVADVGGWVVLRLPRPGSYALHPTLSAGLAPACR